MYTVCEHCLVMGKVLTDLLGTKVSGVIMNRVTREVHSPKTAMIGVQAPEITVDAASTTRLLPNRLSY